MTAAHRLRPVAGAVVLAGIFWATAVVASGVSRFDRLATSVQALALADYGRELATLAPLSAEIANDVRRDAAVGARPSPAPGASPTPSGGAGSPLPGPTPSATLPLPTPTLPIPTPTLPIPTPSLPIPTPSAPGPTPSLPVPTPSIPIPGV